jgi:superfamily II DNA helicase RecQ
MEESVSSDSPRPGKYDSIIGRELCKKILAKYVTYDPHDYILDGVCPVIDGFNLLATTPTGSGKTGFFTLFMLVVREIAADKTLAIGNEVFPIDPVMIVVCPTKALEEDIVGLVITNDRMLLTLAKATQSREVGLTAIVINLDTVNLAWKSKRNIWQEAIKGFTMVMVSPEELASRDFNQLLGVKEFWDRIFALGVDEVHLLYFWGALFRPNYRRIGYLRERLPMSCGRKTHLLAVTATLQEGAPMEWSVCLD